MAITKQYWCPSCGFKSATTDGLIIGKGGCTSCGKSGYKCPRCGMGMKIQRTGQNVARPETILPSRAATKEKSVRMTPTYERAGKQIKIHRA